MIEPQNRIEQDHRVGPRRNSQILAGGLEAVRQRGARGNVASGRSTRSDDAIGIDAEHRRVLPQPAHGAFGILDTDVGRDTVPRFHTVISTRSNETAGRERRRLRFELRELAVRPAAAKEKDDRGSAVTRLPARGEVDHDLQFGLLRLLVNESLRRAAGADAVARGMCLRCDGDTDTERRRNEKSNNQNCPPIPSRRMACGGRLVAPSRRSRPMGGITYSRGLGPISRARPNAGGRHVERCKSVSQPPLSPPFRSLITSGVLASGITNVSF